MIALNVCLDAMLYLNLEKIYQQKVHADKECKANIRTGEYAEPAQLAEGTCCKEPFKCSQNDSSHPMRCCGESQTVLFELFVVGLHDKKKR